MKGIQLDFLVLMAFVILAGGCKVKKPVANSAPAESMTMQALWNDIQKSRLNFDWFYAKVDAEVGMDGFTMSGQADIRIRKDSVLFLSLRKFGFELVRVLIRPDSAFIVNRMEGNFMALSVDSFQTMTGFAFGYPDLEDLMVGNQLTRGFVPFSAVTAEDGYLLKSGSEQIQTDYRIGPDLRVQEVTYRDLEGRSVEASIGGYDELEAYPGTGTARNYYFPQKSNFEYSLSIRIKQMEVDQVKPIKFEIPANYTRL